MGRSRGDPVGSKMGSVGLTAAEGLFPLLTWVALIFELRIKKLELNSCPPVCQLECPVRREVDRGERDGCLQQKKGAKE